MSDNNNTSDERNLDITEMPTGEYPVLVVGDFDRDADGDTSAARPALNASDNTARDEQNDPVRAAFWLSHLESEVARLQAKWQSIDAEFKSREARIAQLKQEINAREDTIAELTAELQIQAAALKAADERLANKEAEIAALNEQQCKSDERIAALSTEIADAEVAHKATRESVKRAEAEVARLNDLVRREREAAAGAAQRNEHLLNEQRALLTKLQDLEIYIAGRHDKWAELNASLADHKEALLGMEKTIKARDAVIARYDDEKRQLAERILDLERQCAELAGRRKEREKAYDDLQEKVAAHFAETEKLKVEYSSRLKEADQAAKQVVDYRRHIESLEKDIKHRDESLEALGAELEQSKATVEELTAAKTKLGKRVDELEKGLIDRSQQVQVLREDLRMSHDQLRIVQEQLSDRTTQLAATQQTLEQKSRQIERLTDELHDAQKATADARSELGALDAHAVELARLRSEALAEVERLKLDVAAQQDLVLSLEAEIRAKQATADLLERNVDRITDLGASLAALDEQMNGGSSKDDSPEIAESPIHVANFVATLAADDRLTAAAPSGESENVELLPIDLLLDDDPNRNVVGIGGRAQIEAGRKLVVTIGGQAFDYPIVKKQMTIGRAHGSDIRIASHFVSRVHAKISTNGFATIIEDAGSKNGVLVNSERVRRRVLRDGDIVSLGDDLNLKFVDATH